MSAYTLEIAAGTLACALAAQDGGADRVELCQALELGGLTPSHATLALARERLSIALYVLIRPRAGDFCYDRLEVNTMRRDIEHCVRLGCDGVVIGALDADGKVDVPLCRTLIAAAGPLEVSFHRAFDAARDRAQALDAVIELGCARVLTSGAAAGAAQAAETLAALVQTAAGRISIMPGAGITAGNLAALARASGAHEFHASAKAGRVSAMRFHNPALTGLAADWQATDIDQVRALRSVLDGLG